MTADRRNDRRSVRNSKSSPYFSQKRDRPGTSNKSTPWSLGSLLSYLNPLRPRNPLDSEPCGETGQTTPENEEDSQEVPSSPSPNGHAPQHVPQSSSSTPQFTPPSHNPVPTTPQTRAESSSIATSSNVSPMQNIDAVKKYLAASSNRQLNQIEIAGLVSLLQGSIEGADEEPQEPFRFSRSPSTPAPDNSPTSPTFTTTANSSFSTDSNQTPSKVLTKNPNGYYRWQGAGSARPSRNRFHSPAFGPSRSSSSKMKITPTESPKTDAKRRRVGPDAETSSPQRVAAPGRSSASPSAQPAAGPSKLSNGPAVTNGITKTPVANGGFPASRTLKPTTPTVPSPLRQAWVQSDPPSPSPHQIPASKPTRAASFMTELIREVTPAKKPDLSNPYQTASPVKPLKPATRTNPSRRVKPSPKPTTEKMEYSEQAIIEATVPKGSKRSRPPANILKTTETDANSVIFPSASPSPPLQQSSFLVNGSSKGKRPVTVHDVDDEEPSTKKQKIDPPVLEPMVVELMETSNDHQTALPMRPSEIVEPAAEGVLHANGTASTAVPVAATVSPSRSFIGLKSSIPKEPSKLRFSIQPEEKEDTTPGASDTKQDPKSDAASLSLKDLPPHVFSIGDRVVDKTIPKFAKGEGDARNLSLLQLPSYEFSFPPVSSNPAKSDMSSSAGLHSNKSHIEPSIAPAGGFNWAAAGLKAPAAPTGAWNCSTCMCSNASAEAVVCSVCDTPR